MYFDISPKTEKKDLFGMDYNLELLGRYLLDHSVRMVVIKGLRRVGKTSLLNIGLQESRLLFVQIDVRDSPFYDKREFIIFLIKKLQEKTADVGKKIWHKITSLSMGYGPFSVDLFFSKEVNVSSFFQQLDKQLKREKKILILAFDEVQLLKNTGFDYFLASVFDNYPQIKLVLTGSEVGVMNQFLGRDEYKAPLFGRAYLEITVGKIKEESVSKFLEEGFAQIKKKIAFGEVQEVISNFDGIIGWATHYGWFRSKGFSHQQALEKVTAAGKIIIKQELESFLASKKSKNNYVKVIRYLAKNKNTWAILKQSFHKEGIKISDSQLGFCLKELSEFGFIEKLNEQYFLADPLMSYV